MDNHHHKTTDEYLEMMSKAVFQAGMSRKVVESKWADTREAFSFFNTSFVSQMIEDDLDTLSNDKRVIRNRPKLDGIVHNARVIIDLISEFGSFELYLRSKTNFPSLVRDLRERFKFLGPQSAYFFLQSVGEEVPDHKSWTKSQI